MKKKKRVLLAVISLLLGVIGILTIPFALPIISLTLAVTALILGIKGNEGGQSGIAVTGIVLSSIMLFGVAITATSHMVDYPIIDELRATRVGDIATISELSEANSKLRADYDALVSVAESLSGLADSKKISQQSVVASVSTESEAAGSAVAGLDVTDSTAVGASGGAEAGKPYETPDVTTKPTEIPSATTKPGETTTPTPTPSKSEAPISTSSEMPAKDYDSDITSPSQLERIPDYSGGK